MPFFDPIRIGASGTVADFTVDRSLRFNSADTAYLNRTPSSASNRKTWTWSSWVKREQASGGTDRFLFIAGQANGADNIAHLSFDSNDRLRLYGVTGSFDYKMRTNSVFRDFSAWYHVVVAFDTTQATASNRIKLYVNGVQVTDLGQSDYPSQNHDSYFNNTDLHNIGRYNGGSTQWYQGYMAEINFIDGFAYDPSYFGETNADTGQWNPKKYTGSYGTNGFYLNFSDNSSTSALGTDSSGNGNNWTPNNFSVSDAVKDTPTNNFCTFNTLSNYDGLTLAEGNLKATSSSSWKQTRGTMGVSSGKWYFEIRCNSIAATEAWIAGIHEVFGRDTDGYYWYNNSYTAAGFGYAYGVQDNNQKRGNTSSMDGSFSSDVTAGKVVGIRMNLDDNEILISVDGVDKGKMYDIQSGITYAPAVNIYGSSSATLNCGQDSTFHGQESSGGNTDSGGIGDFAYAVPSGYKALCSANLPDPTIKLPNEHFNTLLWSGNGAASRSITGLDFQPDWVWLKSRTNTDYHQVHDSVRGIPAGVLFVNTSAVEDSNYPLDSFDSNGFTTSADASDQQNTNGQNYVAWNWNAGNTDGKTYTVTVVSDSGNKYRFDGFGTSAVTLDLAEGGTYIFNYPSAHPFRFSTTADGTHGGGSEYTTGVTVLSSTSIQIVVAASAPQLYYYCSIHSGMGGAINTNSSLGSSNFDGTLQATVKANQTAGFSIGLFTAQTSGSATVGHGLGVAPDVYITKSRTLNGGSWVVYHRDIGENGWILLETSGAATTGNNAVNNPAPTSSVFTYGYGLVNHLSNVFYAFSEVAGYSKFGSYTGNGSSDGTFVFTGFRPAWVMWKATGLASNWVILDSTRDTHNVTEKVIQANEASSENTTMGDTDFLSNGFKIRSTVNNDTNVNAQTYIYLAFAEAPFKNARAR